MGGKSQFTTPVSPPASVKTGAAVGKSTNAFKSQSLRIHESGGFVHFHDDEENARANIPLDAFKAAWSKFKNDLKPFRFIDLDNKTFIDICLKNSMGKVEISINLTSVELGETIANVETLVKG